MRQINLTYLKTTHIHQTCAVYKITDTAFQSNINLTDFCQLIESDKSQLKCSNENSCNCSTLIYADTCSIGENMYEILITSNNTNCYQIKHELETFIVTKNTINAHVKSIDIHLLFGPILILNLALNNTFCLHASAFIFKNNIFIVMAESGTGKSTIARFMEQKNKGSRIADDILPIKIRQNKITVLPDFPQLKLPPEQQYQGESLQKDVILLFAEKSLNKTQIKSISPFEGLKKLIKHSVATKLFTPNDLQKHLDFCFQVSQKAKAFQIDYSHSENSLERLYNEINTIV